MYKKILKTALIAMYCVGALIGGYKVADASAPTLYNCYKAQGMQWGDVQFRATSGVPAQYGIWKYSGTAEQNTLLADRICGDSQMLGGGYSVATGYEKNLRAPMTSVQNYVPVTSFALKDGTTLSISNLGDKVFLTLEPGGVREEITLCTTQDLVGIDWETCARGLAFSGTSTAAVAANARTHPAGSKVVMSNVHYVYEQFVDTNAKDQTIAGNKTTSGNWTNSGAWQFNSATRTTFNVVPTVSTSAGTFLGNNYLATQEYVNSVGAGGFTCANVSTTLGLQCTGGVPDQAGINASSTTGMSFDGSGKLYQKVITNSVLLQDSNGISLLATSTPTAGYLPIAGAEGKMNAWIGFGNGSDGALTISAGTTTINLGGLPFVTKNYTSVSITGTGKLNFSNPAAQGTVVIINVLGNATLSSSADASIDLRGIGSTVASTTGALDEVDHRNGTIYTNTVFYASPLNNNFLSIFGKVVSAGTQGSNAYGFGGLGAGGLSMYVGGNLTGTSTINASGLNGDSSSGACSRAGAGGGSGGDVFVGYKGTYTGTITINNAGGAGGYGEKCNTGVYAGASGAGSSLAAGGTGSTGCPDAVAGTRKSGGAGGGSGTSNDQSTTCPGKAGGASDGGLIQKIY